MPLTRTARLALLLALGFAAGCADTLYQRTRVAPTGPKAQACVERCDRGKDECRARQDTREQECQARYSAAKSDYELCTGGGAANCVPPDTCLGADMSICEREYDGCFTGCGGTLERQPSSRSPESAPGAPAAGTAPVKTETKGG